MTNFEIRPTFFEGILEVHLEVHSFDPIIFHEQRQKMEVQFWSYIREEKRFTSQALLVDEVCRDIKVAKSGMSHLFEGIAIAFDQEFNEEQYAAVNSHSPTNLILAGAGTGKTRTLTYRVAWLIGKGVSPENILLLTFTNKAAKEMLQRVEILTGFASNLFYGGTFHHICQRLLRRHLENPNFAILDEDDSLALFNEAIKSVSPDFAKNKNNPNPRVLYEIMSFSRNTMRTVANAIEEKYPHMADHGGMLKLFIGRYESIKAEQNVMDYDDLLCSFVQLLAEKPDIVERYNQQFQHILVDEYQDTNPIQLKMIDLIAKNGQIFAVGDDAQCIYTWRGANIRSIIEFPQRYPQTKVTKVQVNYRSTPEILDFANAIPVSEKIEYTKILKSTKNPFRKPIVVSVLDARQQANFVVKRLAGLRSEGYPLSEIAILYRAHYQSMELQMELTRSNTPYTITSGVRFFEQAHIKDILAFLRFVINPRDARAFVRIMCRFPKVGEKTAERILLYLQQLSEVTKKDLFSLLDAEEIVKKVPATALEYWWPLVRVLQGLYHGSFDFRKGEQILRQSEDLFEYAQKTHSDKISFENIGEMIFFILEGEYNEYLRRAFANWQTRQDDIEAFTVFCNKFQDISELIQQVTLLQSESNEETVSSEENVRLSTVHQAKGLEFAVVFILSLNENSFPLRRTIEEGDVNEERRLFYVAVTRARQELYLCVPNQAVIDYKKGYFSMPLQRSRFIREIGNDLFDTLNFVEKNKPAFSHTRRWSGRPDSNR
ncbi:MAG: UvrD-helicase domain-containing protein [Puniceicoccales bacterium]|nr:UvrD-helicase domain-containing protein [Puniceicoccales bacterium]